MFSGVFSIFFSVFRHPAYFADFDGGRVSEMKKNRIEMVNESLSFNELFIILYTRGKLTKIKKTDGVK